MTKATVKLIPAYIGNLGFWCLGTIAFYILLDLSFSKNHSLEIDFSYMWRPVCAAVSLWLGKLFTGKVREEIKKDFKMENG